MLSFIFFFIFSSSFVFFVEPQDDWRLLLALLIKTLHQKLENSESSLPIFLWIVLTDAVILYVSSFFVSSHLSWSKLNTFWHVFACTIFIASHFFQHFLLRMRDTKLVFTSSYLLLTCSYFSFVLFSGVLFSTISVLGNACRKKKKKTPTPALRLMQKCLGYLEKKFRV